LTWIHLHCRERALREKDCVLVVFLVACLFNQPLEFLSSWIISLWSCNQENDADNYISPHFPHSQIAWVWNEFWMWNEPHEYLIWTSAINSLSICNSLFDLNKFEMLVADWKDALACSSWEGACGCGSAACAIRGHDTGSR
jgi:hypothetical protein